MDSLLLFSRKIGGKHVGNWNERPAFRTGNLDGAVGHQPAGPYQFAGGTFTIMTPKKICIYTYLTIPATWYLY